MMNCKLSWKACGYGFPGVDRAPQGPQALTEGGSLDAAQQVGAQS